MSAVAVWLGSYAAANAGSATFFTPGDLVVSVEGNGSNTAMGGTSATGNTGADANTYLDNQAAPLTLDEFTTTGTGQTPAVTLELPQTQNAGHIGNSPISGEYGSSSEGMLQLTGNSQYLTIAGYGVNATTYNSTGDKNGAGTALAQSCSLTGAGACGTTPQSSRVIALIGANGGVNTTTVLNNVFNENNPRSVASATGATFYISGQGNYPDSTGGVFFTTLGTVNNSPTSITGNDAGSGTSQDTRDVQIVNGQLYVSTDSKKGATNRSFIGTLGGSPPPTTLANGGNGPSQLPGTGTSTGKETITTGSNGNGNGLNAGLQINLSPESFFFANSSTLYVADSGDGKQNSATSSIGDGGLQKWSLVSGSWVLDYTLSAGLGLVANNSTSTGCVSGTGACTTGLLGLTGKDVTINGIAEVELFATNYTLNDLNSTFLFGIMDVLGDTHASQVTGETFTTLATAPADSNFKGVAFAPTGADPLTPTPLPASWTFMLIGLAGFGWATMRQKSNASSLTAV